MGNIGCDDNEGRAREGDWSDSEKNSSYRSTEVYKGTMEFAAGCMGGLAGIIVGHPADTVKVRIQAQTPCNIRYKGTFDCFAEIIKKESVRGLYKGLLAPMYGTIAVNALIFGVHGNVKHFINIDHPMKHELFAGATAGFIESFVVAPMELVKTRMQLQGEGQAKSKTRQCYKNQPYFYATPVDCIKKIYKYENQIRGLYRGLGITLCREVPAFSLYFGSYYWLCNLLHATSDDAVNILKLLLAGGTAGIISWVFTYPQDVIKTRLQLDGMGKTVYKGSLDCARRIYEVEGLRGYFKGLNATIVRAFPCNGATLATATLFLRYVLHDNVS